MACQKQEEGNRQTSHAPKEKIARGRQVAVKQSVCARRKKAKENARRGALGKMSSCRGSKEAKDWDARRTHTVSGSSQKERSKGRGTSNSHEKTRGYVLKMRQEKRGGGGGHPKRMVR